ncbi:ANTAR domain-containing protein [Streptomyces sp. STR69]|uniref:ANTAR domain-containing protein n=1 Tax=Streptomyces sp. STR69 TaxID=1796942 RepID=UPI0021CA3098|nr:ANTAR domain-containing protein [Streptomyces sp. STR69]
MLTTRHVIRKAMGIAMERYHLAEGGAFAALRDPSQKRNVKLRSTVDHSAGVQERHTRPVIPRPLRRLIG